MNKNFWMFLVLAATLMTLLAPTAFAADVCDKYKGNSEQWLHCKHAESARALSDDVVDLNVAVGILADRDEEVAGRVAALEQKVAEPAPQAPVAERSVLGAPGTTVPAVPVAGPAYYEVGMPGGNAAARSCAMLTGIDTKVEIYDLQEGRERLVSRTPVPTKVLVLKSGEPVAIRTSSGYEPFYADLDRDGQADPTPYNGVAASGSVCIAVEPGAAFEVLYLVRDGYVVVGGQQIEKWKPVGRSYHPGVGYGTHRVSARGGIRQSL